MRFKLPPFHLGWLKVVFSCLLCVKKHTLFVFGPAYWVMFTSESVCAHYPSIKSWHHARCCPWRLNRSATASRCSSFGQEGSWTGRQEKHVWTGQKGRGGHVWTGQKGDDTFFFVLPRLVLCPFFHFVPKVRHFVTSSWNYVLVRGKVYFFCILPLLSVMQYLA